MVLAISALSLAIWLYCVFLRGGFWRGNVVDGAVSQTPSTWPHVIAVIPARNEEQVISASLTSLLRQNYQGRFSIIVVDDNSEDATAAIAQALPGATGSSVPLTVLRGEPLPNHWTGKLWALDQGIAAASRDRPEFLLLTDADIVYEPDVIAALASRSVTGGYV